jgi:hypothetical protein
MMGASLAFLASKGGFCDCEVFVNVVCREEERVANEKIVAALNTIEREGCAGATPLLLAFQDTDRWSAFHFLDKALRRAAEHVMALTTAAKALRTERAAAGEEAEPWTFLTQEEATASDIIPLSRRRLAQATSQELEGIAAGLREIAQQEAAKAAGGAV